MQRLVIISFCLLFSHSALIAQDIKFGFKLNPLIGFASQTDQDGQSLDDRETSARIGWVYGLVMDNLLSENYGFHTGITIVNKGWDETFRRDTLPASNQSVRVTSLEIPFTALLRSNEIGSDFFIKGFFGLSMDINIGYKNSYTGSHPFQAEPGSGELRGGGRVRDLALSFVVGPGVDWETSFGTLGLGITWHQGLTNINKKKNTGNDIIIRPRYLSFDVEYFF